MNGRRQRSLVRRRYHRRLAFGAASEAGAIRVLRPGRREPAASGCHAGGGQGGSSTAGNTVRRRGEWLSRLLARGTPFDVAGHQQRVHVLEHRLAGDDDPLHVLAARHLVHDRHQDLFQDRPQPAGAGPAQDRLVGDGLERVVGELQVDAVQLEQPPVLADQRIARLGQDPDERLAVEVVHAGDDRQPADELGDHAELQQVLRHHLGERVGRGLVGLHPEHGAEAHAAAADPAAR